MKLVSRIALPILLFSLACSHSGEPSTTSAEVANSPVEAALPAEVAVAPEQGAADKPSDAEVSKREELLWSLSENGRFEVKVESYDRARRIVHISRPESPQRGFDTSPSKLAYLFDHGALPYQFDGTNWVALWSPFLPPDSEAIE